MDEIRILNKLSTLSAELRLGSLVDLDSAATDHDTRGCRLPDRGLGRVAGAITAIARDGPDVNAVFTPHICIQLLADARVSNVQGRVLVQEVLA